jgi:uncharacterized membrane protein
MKKSILFILILILCLLVAGCELITPFDPRFRKTIVTGVVNDYNTGEPIIDAIVSIDDTQYRTDSQGRYQTDLVPQGKYIMDCVAQGYASEEKSVYLNQTNMVINFRLKPSGSVTTGSISGLIIEKGTDKKISGAIVSLTKNDDVIVADITGDNGMYSMVNVPFDIYTMSVTAAGYKSITETVEIRSGSTARNIELEKSEP